MKKFVFFYLFFCFAAQNFAFAQIGVSGASMEVPSVPACTDMQLMKSVPCSDKELFFHQGQSIVQGGFNEGNYNLLSDTYYKWCTGKERFPDGRWKLSQYANGLEVNFRAWNTWDKDLLKIKKWQTESPLDESAKFVEGVYWYAYAMKARGNGYSNSVSKEAWQLFYERMKKSKEVFGGILKNGNACPAVYARMLDLMVAIGDKESALKAIFDEGTTKYPQYHNIYFAMARYYQPKWYGDINSYENFAVQAAQKTKSFEGDGMYARLYWLVDDSSGIPFNQSLNVPPYWNKLKQGYEDLMARYPSSIHNIGKYAGVACRTSEAKLYLKLRKKIDGYENGAEFYDSVDVCDLRHGWKE